MRIGYKQATLCRVGEREWRVCGKAEQKMLLGAFLVKF